MKDDQEMMLDDDHDIAKLLTWRRLFLLRHSRIHYVNYYDRRLAFPLSSAIYHQLSHRSILQTAKIENGRRLSKWASRIFHSILEFSSLVQPGNKIAFVVLTPPNTFEYPNVFKYWDT